MQKEKEKETKRNKKEKEENYKIIGSLYKYTLLSKEFLLFSTVPIPVEMVMPK